MTHARKKEPWGKEQEDYLDNLIMTRAEINVKEVSEYTGYSLHTVRKYATEIASRRNKKFIGLWTRDVAPLRDFTARDIEMRKDRLERKDERTNGVDDVLSPKKSVSLKPYIVVAFSEDSARIKLKVKARSKKDAEEKAKSLYNLQKIAEVYTLEQHKKKPKPSGVYSGRVLF